MLPYFAMPLRDHAHRLTVRRDRNENIYYIIYDRFLGITPTSGLVLLKSMIFNNI